MGTRPRPLYEINAATAAPWQSCLKILTHESPWQLDTRKYSLAVKYHDRFPLHSLYKFHAQRYFRAQMDKPLSEGQAHIAA